MINRIIECFPSLPGFQQKSKKLKVILPDILSSSSQPATESRTLTVLHKTAESSLQANEPQTGFTLVCLNGSFFLKRQENHYPVCKEWLSCFQNIENLSEVPMLWLTITDYNSLQLQVIRRTEGFYPAAAYQKIAQTYEEDRQTTALCDMRYAVVNEPFFVDLQQPAQVSQAYFDSGRGLTIWHHTKALSKQFCAAAFHIQDRPNDPVNLFTSVLKSSVNLFLCAIPRELNHEWDKWSGRELAVNSDPSNQLFHLFKQSLTQVSRTEAREYKIRGCFSQNPYATRHFDRLIKATNIKFIDNFYDDAEEILKSYIFEDTFRTQASAQTRLSLFFYGHGPLVSFPETHPLAVATNTRLFVSNLTTQVNNNNIEVQVDFIPVYVSGTMDSSVLTLAFEPNQIYQELLENSDTHWLNQYSLRLSGVYCSEIAQAFYHACPDIKMMALAEGNNLLNNSTQINVDGERTVQKVTFSSSKKQTQIALQKLSEYGVSF